MKCAKCGKKLKSNEKFCTYCGYFNADEKENVSVEETEDEDAFDDNWYDEEITPDEDDEVELEPVKEVKKENKPKKEIKDIKPKEEKVKVVKTKKEKPVKEVKIKVKEDNEVYDQNEKYIEAYIGEDYKLIKKSPFNIWAFLLNWMYFLYRKLYITGIIGLIITAVVAFFFTKYFLIYVIVTLLVLGIGFNPYYIFIVKRKVKKILYDYEGSDSFSLQEICSELGGVNVVMALIIYFAFLVAIVISILKPSLGTSTNAFFKENSENKANCNYLIKQIYHDIKSYSGNVEEALCKVNKNSKNYDIYFKTKKDSKTIYVYYATENEYIVYKNNTETIEAFNKKKAENRITEDEEKNLNEMKAILSNYESIHKEALKEDKLIEANKNKEEKLNYIFNHEEIIR